jgi:methylphosphotriester-DNA--protein-cysteine methyltransferase
MDAMPRPHANFRSAIVDRDRAVALRSFLVQADRNTTIYAASRTLGLSDSAIRRALRTTWNVSFHDLVDQVRLDRLVAALECDPTVKVLTLTSIGGWRSRTSMYAAIRRVTGGGLQLLRHNALEKRGRTESG